MNKKTVPSKGRELTRGTTQIGRNQQTRSYPTANQALRATIGSPGNEGASSQTTRLLKNHATVPLGSSRGNFS